MKLRVERSISINKSISAVYAIIADLSNWNKWSPWIHSEPTAKTQLSGVPGQVGQSQSWEGEVIGSGRMTLIQLQKDENVKIKLEFFKPWKGVSTATFKIQSDAAGFTMVTWTLDSDLPFFMFFLKNMMTAYMNEAFNRGLQMLKEYTETGAVSSRSIYQSKKMQSSFQVVGKKTSCAIVNLSKSMYADYQQMMELTQKNELTPPQKAVALFPKFDIPKGVCEYIAGYQYPVGQDVKVPAAFSLQELPPHEALLVDHYGAYRYLGNPWAMAVSYQRGKKMKVHKKIPMYEIYVTMPDGRPEKDIHTQIFLPVK